MDIRQDFKIVEESISRLINIGEEFRKNNSYWGHLKNKEDFRFIYRLPDSDKIKLEALYSAGRDIAIFMGDALTSVNFDFSRYPTLTSVIESFDETWVYNDNLTKYIQDTRDVYGSGQIELWSVREMVALFQKQLELLKVVNSTLSILKQSKWYKIENEIKIMEENPSNITITNVKGSNIIVGGSNISQALNIENSTQLFSELIKTIETSTILEEEKNKLASCVKELQEYEGTKGFGEKYKNFIQNAASHMSLVAAFIPYLTALL